MPIFEYICKDCGKQFEAVLIGDHQAECPGCKGQQLEQQLSTFAVNTKGSSNSRPTPHCGMANGGGCGGCGFNN